MTEFILEDGKLGIPTEEDGRRNFVVENTDWYEFKDGKSGPIPGFSTHEFPVNTAKSDLNCHYYKEHERYRGGFRKLRKDAIFYPETVAGFLQLLKAQFFPWVHVQKCRLDFRV